MKILLELNTDRLDDEVVEVLNHLVDDIEVIDSWEEARKTEE